MSRKTNPESGAIKNISIIIPNGNWCAKLILRNTLMSKWIDFCKFSNPVILVYLRHS